MEVICKLFANDDGIKVTNEKKTEKNLKVGNSHLPKVSAYDVEKPH